MIPNPHMNTNKSEELFERAKDVLVGGVNSPVRAFTSVGGTPPFIKSAKGAYIYDEDGNKYIDYVGSWGPMILGHTNPKVVNAIKKAAESGTSFGAPTENEIILAQMIRDLYPSMEQVRFVNSGTEAAMSAIRLARGVTNRRKIVKFEGCYHGHADHLLVKAGSGALTLAVPSSEGVPEDFAIRTLVADYNDTNSVQALFEKDGSDIAAVIVEPVAGNMGCIPPEPGFLQFLRKICNRHNALLIFDEVMTGFRVAPGGAQELYGVTPDITCLGKIVGGGLPVGAYGGRRVVMQHLAPEGRVYQAGTLSGNPLAMVAGIETLKQLVTPGFYERLEAMSKRLVEGLSEEAQAKKIPHFITRVGSMWTLFFTRGEVKTFADVMNCDQNLFNQYFHCMLSSGIYLAPSAYEAGFVSAAHTEEDIDATIKAAGEAFKCL